MEKIKALVIKVGQFPEVHEFASVKTAFNAIGVKTSKGNFGVFETMLFNDGAAPFEGIGIVTRDQDLPRLKKNILGLKGSILLIGMDRVGDARQTHTFYGLNDVQIAMLQKKLGRAIAFDIMGTGWGSEI